MPCETFSTAGNSSRAAYDDRQFLFREGIRIAQIVNAKMILFENVPNIQNKRIAKDSKELVIDYLKKELEEAGYGNFKEFVLDASKYGVPQKRKRFFILASKDSQIDVSQTPVETTPDKEVTVKDAFIDIPEVIANHFCFCHIFNSCHKFILLFLDFYTRAMDLTPHELTAGARPKDSPLILFHFSLNGNGHSLKGDIYFPTVL